MAIASKLMDIGIIVVSIAAGFISFYIISNLSKGTKKRNIEELTSQFINFVIFIWLGKIIIHFSTFIKDPLAILAYPSDSSAFYLAVLFIAILLAYKAKRKKLDSEAFTEAFLHVFLVASFSFEFIQLVWNNNPFALGYLILLTILLVLYFTLNERITVHRLVIILLIGWSSGMTGLFFLQPIVTVFGYNLTRVAVALFFVICFLIILFIQRKRDK
ncbi:hypothetical protein [Oceanobacillus sp. FSL H7-0719]|uniref:hypothetical protein n=1 Tax=Oceanobacillus sp. FSL H7-0719 TaxID=2954507 RepID=UPI00324C78CC